MSFRIDQDFEYIGKDYWRWWAWIDGPEAELDEVQEVAWILHPSFKRTREVRTDRTTRFRLDSAGWGTFLLRAEVLLRNDETRSLRRNLKLAYPGETTERAPEKTGAPAEPARPLKVFLSYGAQDARLASRLRAGLIGEGLDVLDATRIEPGDPWADAVRRMIAQSDAVIGLISEEDVSPVVAGELALAAASAKRSFALLPEGGTSAEIPGSAKRLHFDSAGPRAASIATELRSQSLDE